MKKYQSYPDDALLRLLSNDDKEAFAELYHRYWMLLYKVASKKLQDAHLAEDVVQDVLLSIWKNRTEARIEQLEPYLVSATKYAVLGILRRKIQSQTNETTVVSNGIETTTETGVYYKQLFHLAQQEINRLPEKRRLIYKYSREEGLSNKEIASVLHISTKTVENQMNKALRQLRFSVRKMLQFFF